MCLSHSEVGVASSKLANNRIISCFLETAIMCHFSRTKSNIKTADDGTDDGTELYCTVTHLLYNLSG